jgi:hypothetical protein
MAHFMNFWLSRIGSSLRLCAVIPANAKGDLAKAATIYASPGEFLTRLDPKVIGAENASEIRKAIIHGIGTLNEVFTVSEIELNPAQISSLGLVNETSDYFRAGTRTTNGSGPDIS